MTQKTQSAVQKDMLVAAIVQQLQEAFALTGSSAHYLACQPWEMMPDVAQIRNADMSLDFLGVVRMRTGGHALGSTVTRETKPYHITEFCPMCISNTAGTPPHTLHQCTHGDIAQARAAEGAQLQAHLRRQVPGWGNFMIAQNVTATELCCCYRHAPLNSRRR